MVVFGLWTIGVGNMSLSESSLSHSILLGKTRKVVAAGEIAGGGWDVLITMVEDVEALAFENALVLETDLAFDLKVETDLAEKSKSLGIATGTNFLVLGAHKMDSCVVQTLPCLLTAWTGLLYRPYSFCSVTNF